jgi:amidohydrolase
MNNINFNLLSEVEAILPVVINHRRHIHKYPELSFQEFKTTEYIASKLEEIGIQYRTANNTGIVGIIGNGGKCVALRADIDALPIIEDTGLEFSSCHEGIMHACGHDMHTAMLLGAAMVLKNHEAEINGTIKLIFQPAEEKLPGGASILIENGVLKDPDVDIIFGQHVNPGQKLGEIAFKDGPVMASADELYWTIQAESCHAAQPHLGSDAILASASLISNLHNLVNKTRNPIIPGLLSITSVHGGSATNIFPDEVKMMGTLRSFDENWRIYFHQILENTTKSICYAYGTTGSIDIIKGYPPLINDKKATNLAYESATKLFGKECVIEFEPKLWAEDFAYYSQQIPSCFWFIGIRPDDMESMPALHNPKFSPDENALLHGTAMLVASALNYLGNFD